MFRCINDSSTPQLNDSTTPQLNDSTTQRLNDSTIPQLNNITTQRLNNSTTQRFNDSSTQQLHDFTIQQLNNNKNMNKNAKIYIAGHMGMVGSAIKRNLESKGFTNFVTRSFQELDLLNENDVADFFRTEKPDYVVLAAAKVGGIVANNTYRAQFIYENLQIQNHVIHHSYLNGVKKLLFLGSSCIYPRDAAQPMNESALLTGLLENTNEPYAIV